MRSFRFKKLDQRGVSILEILIAGMLLSGVIVGVLKAFTSAQTLAPPFIAKSIQSNLGREKLEGMYESVRQDQWSSSSNSLYPGTSTPSLSGHASTCKVSNVAGADYRKVELTVS